MKLSSITIRGMHKVENKTYDISGFRYFYGENGAGKSTIMQAVQLALLGYIPGTDKTKSAIFKHSNGPEMFIKLNLDDNGKDITIIRTWRRKGKDISAVCEVEPAIYNPEAIVGSLELPVFNFSEFVGMTANKLKDWFIKFLPAADNELNWDMLLSDAISDFEKILDPDFYVQIVNYVRERSETVKGVQLVRDFNAYLKEQQTYYKSEITRLQNTIQSLIYYDDCDDSLDIDSIKSEITTAQMKIDNLNSKLIKIQQNERLLADLETAKSKLEGEFDYNKTLEENLEDNPLYKSAMNAKAVQSDIQSKCTELHRSYNEKRVHLEAKLKAKQQIIESNGACPFTCSECSTIINMITQFKKEISQIKSDMEKLAVADNKAVSDYNEAAKLEKNADNTVERIRRAYVTYSALAAQIHSDITTENKENIVESIGILKSKVQQYTDMIIKLEANRKYSALTDNITNDKYKAEQNLEMLKVWIKLTDVNGLQTQLMEAPFKKLADNMSVYLQQFFSGNSRFSAAKFYLSEKANSFSFGVIDISGEYIEFDLLSSGEKCLYTLALLLSIVESSDAPLKLIMIDDLLDHLDMARIEDCFKTLYSISGIQVLLAGVQNCHHPNSTEFAIKV